MSTPRTTDCLSLRRQYGLMPPITSSPLECEECPVCVQCDLEAQEAAARDARHFALAPLIQPPEPPPPAPTDAAPAPWETYTPPMSADGRVLVDPRAERAAGLKPKDFAERLRLNGVADKALEIAVEVLQDPEVAAKTKLSAAKDLLDRAHGSPAASAKPDTAPVNVLILDLYGARPAEVPPVVEIEGEAR